MSKEELVLAINRISQLCEQYILANRLEFGKAELASTMKRLLGEQPNLRSQGKRIAKLMVTEIERINSMPLDVFETFVRSNYPNLMEEKKLPKEKKEAELPALVEVKQGEIITRLPPEPSGYPHIGHAYSFFINHYYARKYEGKVILRFEDTNPVKVDLEYYDVFREALEFLGISWDEEIIESDHIELYYQYAKRLIDQGYAYVCQCPVNVVRRFRDEMQECKHRNVSVEESQNQWEEMLEGSFEQGQATLRLRLSMTDYNPVLRDPAIMRVSYAEHPIQRSKYSVWPLYDFAVSLEDGSRGITHVFRSEEFAFRIPLQNKIRKLVGLSNPRIIHFSRLRIKGTPVQKRLLRSLVDTNVVTGWDDIRLSTIAGLKRRGILPQTIYNLAFELQLSTTQSETDWSLILAINRKLIDYNANRYFAVLNPIKLRVSRVRSREVRLALHPEDRKRGERILTTGQDFYLDSSDIKGFEVGTKLRLKDLYNLQIDEIQTDSVLAHFIGEKPNHSLPKIQWVPVEEALPITLSFPDVLFKNNCFNPESLVVKRGWSEKSLGTTRIGDIIQLERVGFGRIDLIRDEEIQINMCERLPSNR